ncbi:hypothetical protein SAMD00019534_023890, partial [Acytostelium subglobosum LB1]|uniref:hypothetical protein n=1 Tax=Acytostelium subglobosum LB1 TaxID=1410327 RepID=UPI0006449894
MPLHKCVNDFFGDKASLKTGKIAALLDGNRIGIEASHWGLLKLHGKEPFQIAMGGAPLTLYTSIQTELDKFKKANLHPLFVFSGLSILKDRNNAFIQPQILKAQKLSAAWEAYYKQQGEQAEKMFSVEVKQDKSLIYQFIPSLVSYFKQNNVECFKSPYMAAGQLALFSDPTQKNYINAVWGGLELLLFGVHRLIVDIDFEKGTFDWIDLKHILKEDLQMTHDQFVDACILAGYEFCNTFTGLTSSFGHNFNFRHVCDLVKQHQTGLQVIQDYQYSYQNVEKYMEQFMKTKCLIRNHLVYTPSCICEPLYKDLSFQTDLNTIFGPKLPNDLFFYISQGVVNPQVINNLLSGFLNEPFPSVDSEEYRKMLEYLREIRTNTLGLLSSCFNEDIAKRVVKNIRWYEPKEEEIAHTKKVSHLFGRHSAPSSIFTSALKSQLQTLKSSPAGSPAITLNFVAKCIPENVVGSLTSSPSTSDASEHNGSNGHSIQPIKDINEAAFYVFYQTLVLMGYIQDNNLTTYGRLLDMTKKSGFQQELIITIELIRAQCLTSEKLTFLPKPTFEGPPTNISAFLSRLLSILPCTMDNNPWEGPIDHDLMAFHEITRTLYKSVRNLLEISSLSNFLTHKIQLDPAEYFNFAAGHLPFFVQPNASMGLLVKGMILEEMSIDQLESVFPNCTSIEKDLQRATEFLDEVMQVATVLLSEGLITQQLYDNFVESDSTWKRVRQIQKEAAAEDN